MTTKEEVMQKCTIQGNIVKLPAVKLDDKLYKQVKEVITKHPSTHVEGFKKGRQMTTNY